MKRTNSVLILVISLTAAVNIFALRPGDLDPSFGSGGKVYNLPTNFMPAEDVAIQSDGKLVLAGSTLGPDNTQDFAVVRLNANGSPDTGFGTGGLVGIPFDTNFNEMGVAVVIQTDGKIVVAGNVQLGTSGWDFGIARLNANGTPDGTYNGGKVKVGVNNAGGDDFVFDMALQADGKVVITGTTRPSPNKDIAVVRMSTTGVVDARLTIASGGGLEDEGLALAIQSDQNIVIAGSMAGDFVVLRLTPLMALDLNFGSGGFVLTPIGTQLDRATSVAIQSDGKIIAAGTANSGSFDEFAFARYTPGGQPDTSFDGDGKVSYDVRASNSDLLSSVLIQSDGKIIGVGTSGGSYVLVRLNSAGALDSSFGTGGKVIQNVAPTASGAHRAILQPDGKIVAVGDGSGPGTFGFTAARFLTVGTSSTPFDFDGDGKTDIGIFRPSDGTWWINRSSVGITFAAQFGIGTDRIVPADFTGDGKTDHAVWRPSTGDWFVLRSEDGSFFAFPFGTNGDVPVPADYDGDGKADPAVFRPSNATWYIQRSSDNGVSIQQFGATGDRPVAADYDGDGRADLAIFRPSDGTWWLNRSTAGVVVAQFGNSSDKQVPGDYTGDGKADIAFWRPTTGDWFILRSEDFSFYAGPFGANGDVPAPGDYDGDGKFDTTVFRPSNATWYSQRSTGGTVIQQFGLASDRPVPNAYVP
ncbi:MAG TPA: FG-GAP-like repeat-containing protein [Pyrinomonadaceae bacterium]|nr:FG-GAP-like repeat-containing protein [Pyrinomonadaceae bacterium]